MKKTIAGYISGIEAVYGLLKQRLWMQILLAMALGLSLGLVLSPQGGALVAAQTSASIAAWLKLPGTIFLNLIQMVVVPLVMASIMLGINSSGDMAYLKKVGLRIFPYFVMTTIVAVTIGLVVTNIIQPGDFITLTTMPSDVVVTETLATQSVPERIGDLIPSNPDAARVAQDMLQIVIFAIIAGIALLALPSNKAAPLLALLDSVQELSLKVVSWAMKLAPYAVFGLLADVAIRVGLEALVGLSVYVGTVLFGLFCLLGFYLIVVTVLAKRNPLHFLTYIRDVQLLAFSTSSSAAVMPVSMEVAEKKLGVKPAISKFIIPLGATINMDGTALYQVVAAVFLAQVYGVEMSTMQMVLLAVTTVGASIGSPSTPGVGIIILATILTSFGIPAEGIAIIIGVDRILDMCRTTVNVSGDLTACLVMDKWMADVVPSDNKKSPE